MQTPKPSTFIIALIWVGFFAAVFGAFTAQITTRYNATYDESQIETYNKLNELNTEVSSYQTSALDFKENTGVFDVIGGYFSNGYKTLKVTLSSLDIFNSMVNDALNNPQLNIPAFKYLNTAVVATMAVFIIIGVMLSAILKKDV